jgi:hypothetical protein
MPAKFYPEDNRFKTVFGVSVPKEISIPRKQLFSEEELYQMDEEEVKKMEVKWAVRTAAGLCGRFTDDPKEYRACMITTMPRLLEPEVRGKWSEGIGEYLGLTKPKRRGRKRKE